MPTPGGLPKVGETWRLTWRLPPDYEAQTTVVRVLERGQGSYWSLRIRHVDTGAVHLWVDASHWWKCGQDGRGSHRLTYVEPGGSGWNEAIERLKAIDPSDPESAHALADAVLLEFVPVNVAAAYKAVENACSWWAAS